MREYARAPAARVPDRRSVTKQDAPPWRRILHPENFQPRQRSKPVNDHIHEDVPVRLGKRVWTVRLTPGAVAAIERHTGMDFDEVAREVWENDYRVDTMAAVLWAGIAAAHDDAPGFEAVGEMMLRQGTLTVLRPVLVYLALAQARAHAAVTRAALEFAMAQASAKGPFNVH